MVSTCVCSRNARSRRALNYCTLSTCLCAGNSITFLSIVRTTGKPVTLRGSRKTTIGTYVHTKSVEHVGTGGYKAALKSKERYSIACVHVID